MWRRVVIAMVGGIAGWALLVTVGLRTVAPVATAGALAHPSLRSGQAPFLRDPRPAQAPRLAAAPATRLVVKLPGQTFTSGSPISGTPTPQVAGQLFEVSVYAVDDTDTIDLSNSSSVTISIPNDSRAAYPTIVDLGSGQGRFSLAHVKAGTQTILASSSGLTTASVDYPVRPGDLEALVITGGPMGPLTAGDGFGATGAVTVTAYDRYDNVKTDYTGAIYFISNDPRAAYPFTVSSPYQFSAGDNGSRVFDGTGFIFRSAGSRLLTVTDGRVAGMSEAITIRPGPLDHLTIAGVPATVTAGQSFTATVSLYDPYGNVKTDYLGPLYFLSTDPSARLPHTSGTPYQFVADDQGAKAFAGLVMRLAGGTVLTATTGTITRTLAATVNPGPLARFGISGTPASVTAGDSFGLMVTAYDEFGNTKTDYLGPVFFTSTTDSQATFPATATSPYTFVPGDAGVHAFSGLVLRTAGPQQVAATNGSLALAPVPLAVSPAELYRFQVDPIAKQTAGVPFAVTIRARDRYDNTVTSFTSANTLAVTQGPIEPSAIGPFVDGVATVPVTLTRAATVQLVTLNLAQNVGGASASFVVQPGPLAAFALSQTSPGPLPAGSNLAGHDLSVVALDAYANQKTNYRGSIYFTSTDPQATLPYTATSRYSFGEADQGAHIFGGDTFTLRAAGNQRIVVTDGVIAAPTAELSITPGPLDRFTFDPIRDGMGEPTAGAPFAITIRARDAYGNVVDGFTGSTILANERGLIDPTLAGFNASVATTTITLVRAGLDRLTTFHLPTSKSGQSDQFTVRPAALGALVMEGGPLSPTLAGQAFGSQSVVVIAYDRFTNRKTDFAGAVYFTSTDPLATLPYTATSRYAFTAGDQGRRTFDGSLFRLWTAGTHQITVTDGTVSATSAPITVRPAALDHVEFEPIPTATAGVPIAVTVRARDQAGNLVADYAGRVRLTGLLGDISPTLSPPLVDGAATFNITLTRSGRDQLTATDETTGRSGSSASFTVRPGSLNRFAIGGGPGGTVVAGEHFGSADVTVTAYDAYGNVKTDYLGPVFFFSSDPRATLPYTVAGAYAFTQLDAGVHTFAGSGFRLRTAGPQQLVATDGTGAADAIILIIEPGPLAQFRVDDAPATRVADEPFAVTIRALDASDNPRTDYSGPVYLESSDAQAALPCTATAPCALTESDGGRRAFDGVRLRTAGSETIVATNGAVTGPAATVVVNPAAVGRLTFDPVPDQTVDVPFAVVVRARDAYSNTVTSFTGSATLTSALMARSEHPAKPLATTAFVGGVATATVTLARTGLDTLQLAVEAPAMAVQSNAFAVRPGALDRFALTGAPAAVTAGEELGFTVTTLDARGNVKTDFAGGLWLTTTDPRASIPYSSTAPLVLGPGDAGMRAIAGIRLRTAGAQRVTVTNGLVSTPSDPVTVQPAALDHFAVETANAATAGVPISTTVRALDAFGNVVTSFGDAVGLGAQLGEPTPRQTPAFTSGVVTLAVTLTRAGTDQVTVGHAGSGRQGTSGPIVVAPGPLARFQFEGAPASLVAGTRFGFTLSARDAYGNILAGFTGPVSFAMGDARADNPYPADRPYTFTAGDQGSHAFVDFTLRTSGSQTIVASGAIVTGTLPVAISPAAAVRLGLDPIGDQLVDVPFTLVVTAYDQFDNVATGYTGTISLVDTTGTVVPSNAGPFGGGRWRGAVRIRQANQQTIVNAIGLGSTYASDVFAVRRLISNGGFESGALDGWEIPDPASKLPVSVVRLSDGGLPLSPGPFPPAGGRGEAGSRGTVIAPQGRAEPAVQDQVREAGSRGTAIAPRSVYAALLGDPSYYAQGRDGPGGSVPIDAAEISQFVQLPDVAGSRLRLTYRLFGHDTRLDVDGVGYDFLQVTVRKVDSARPTELHRVSAATLPPISGIDYGWMSVVLDLSPWRGQQVELRLTLQNRYDGQGDTWVYVTDVAYVNDPSPTPSYFVYLPLVTTHVGGW
ncbi:MAG: hypothetical protein HYY04_13335 [Chloroflexi bacterium]|nr:hypothetical protein [Chloroflexota bacterium]